MRNPEKKADTSIAPPEGTPGWGGTGFGGSGYGSHKGFGDAVYGQPVEEGLARLDPPPSDEAMTETIQQLLTELKAVAVEVQVEDAEVTLAGVLHDADERQELLRRVHELKGVLKVHNRLRAQDPDDWAPQA